MNIYVGNLAPEVTETELADAFKAFGQVKSAQVMRELFSGASKGFGFVEMPGKQHSLGCHRGLERQGFLRPPAARERSTAESRPALATR